MAEDKKATLGKTEQVVVDARPLEAPGKLSTRPFRLKPGAAHFHDGRQLASGDVVGLTVHQAEAFADKFQDVSLETSSVEQDELTRLRAENAELRGRVGSPIPDPNSGIRQDVGSNTPLHKETVLSTFDKDKLPESGVKDKAKVAGLQPAGSVAETPAPAGSAATSATPKGGSTDTSAKEAPKK